MSLKCFRKWKLKEIEDETTLLLYSFKKTYFFVVDYILGTSADRNQIEITYLSWLQYNGLTTLIIFTYIWMKKHVIINNFIILRHFTLYCIKEQLLNFKMTQAQDTSPHVFTLPIKILLLHYYTKMLYKM